MRDGTQLLIHRFDRVEKHEMKRIIEEEALLQILQIIQIIDDL